MTKLNALDAEAAQAAFMRCCGSTKWAAAMVAARPFSDPQHLFDAADLAWWAQDAIAWREAFSHHPKIGANVEALRAKFAATADWSAGEQSGVAGASEATIQARAQAHARPISRRPDLSPLSALRLTSVPWLQALAQGNKDYDAKFGHVFLICATGKSADEMLAALQARLPNEPAAEMQNAATEQAKITRIRLEKLTFE